MSENIKKYRWKIEEPGLQEKKTNLQTQEHVQGSDLILYAPKTSI